MNTVILSYAALTHWFVGSEQPLVIKQILVLLLSPDVPHATVPTELPTPDALGSVRNVESCNPSSNSSITTSSDRRFQHKPSDLPDAVACTTRGKSFNIPL